MSETNADALELEAERIAERIRRQPGGWASHDLRIGPETAADLLGVTVGTLRNWRYLSQGPAAVRIGGRITYRITDLLAMRETY